ncbi:MutS family DNA mismatch repair protein [Gracilimonas mengyeensis]|uniref:MutS domain V n=1 Tax=Gracilimonas mengyeensis TaxID=1302730 RepID=A0A521EA39_9BACT|nr:MutS family DNA mismatch repair protein [Gracilimonas mengyeensis]SMO80796.1 MutS domain V [Gracilimonas mengyeensis]
MNHHKQKELYERHCRRIDHHVEKFRECSTKFSWARGVVFFVILAFVFFTADLLNDYVWTAGLIAGIAGFIYLVSRHYKVHQAIEKLGHLKKIKQEHIARMELEWEEIPELKITPELDDHAYADDLNIIGKRSLHRLLDTSVYKGGSQILLDWLTNTEPKESAVKERQGLVRELIPLQAFRDKLAALGKYTVIHESEKDWGMEDMLKWLRLPKKQGFIKPLVILSVLSLFNITAGMAALIGMLSWLPMVFGLVVYLSVYKFYSEKTEGLFEAAYQMEKLLSRFRSLLLHVENFELSRKPKLADFLKAYHEADTKPSVYLNKVNKITGPASIQKNQFVGPIVNLIIPWDMYYSMKMENLKQDLEPRLSEWLDLFYQLEALNSLANFSSLHPEYNFPVLDDKDDLLFEAQGLGHPLIPEHERVSNDFKIEQGKDLFLITGSNMAGKSTFLRTVGINLVLSFAGATVCAQTLESRLFRLFTSINVKDSLGDGLSHFYAEVRRLRRLMNELEDEHELPLFYFVDEIFKGTNNRERYQGSAAFLKNVAGKNGVGMVSTHDLELSALESEIPQLSNWHFAETIEDGKMHFEYKIKPGPCPTTNALKIMELEGLPVK